MDRTVGWTREGALGLDVVGLSLDNEEVYTSVRWGGFG